MRHHRIRLAAALVAVLCLLTTPAITRTQSADAFAGFEAFVDGILKDWNVPGVAVGAIQDGKVILAKGYGLRDVEKQLPVTERTLMPIGSTSKSFTVSLLGMLSDEKKLDWDTPVRNYLPDFELKDDIATRLMTPTDLVTHRSGLPRHDAMWHATPLTRKDLYERLRFLEPSATFRQRYQYNNLMFLTAGILAERLAGDSWESLVRQRLFVPLGMTRTNTSVTALAASDDFSRGYVEQRDRAVVTPFRNIDAIGPAGSINSSVEEMLRYVQMHIDYGKVGERQVVSRAFALRMQSPHSATPVSTDTTGPVFTEIGPGAYGLGVSVRSYRGHKLVDHGGAIDGFSAAMSWLPHKRIGVVVLVNRGGAGAVANALTYNVYDRLLGLDHVDFNGRAKIAQQATRTRDAEREKRRAAERVAGTSPSRPLAQFAGTYEHPAYGAITITDMGERLVVARFGAPRIYEHFHYDVFQSVVPPTAPAWTGRQRITFTTSLDGKVESVAIPYEPEVAPIVFKRQAPGKGTSSN